MRERGVGEGEPAALPNPRVNRERRFVYALVCPLSGEPRYVGRTWNPRRRRVQHENPNGLPSDHPRRTWVERLRERGLSPEFVVLETVERGEGDPLRLDDRARERELCWIEGLRTRGFRLLNCGPDARWQGPNGPKERHGRRGRAREG